MAKSKAKAKAKPKSKSKSKSRDSITMAEMKRAIEGRNARALSGFYSDDAVMQVVDRDNPPSKPNTIVGKKAITAFFSDVCGRDMTHKLVKGVADNKHIAFTQNCTYPDGTRVLCSTMIELKGGKIAKQTVVQAWDG
jgi:SnoaL-like domain